MNKSDLKNFAINARLELLQRVADRAALYGINEENSSARSIAPSQTFCKLGGAVLTAQERAQRTALVARIYRSGYRQTMEEAAYTWFNRFMALRYLQAHHLLPVSMRVLPDAPGAQPQLLRQAQDAAFDGVDMQQVLDMLDANRTEELYKYLLITLCNALSQPLPVMFETISDYTELLFPDGLLRADSVLGQLAQLDEDCWEQIQVIGWLYQYYNTQLKDETFELLKKNVKITKERIGAATQLFTPEWIVRYMVENSLGRLWQEGHPQPSLRQKWRYYMDEAQQPANVQAQLDELRRPYASLQPEQITVLDPCMGSGHILVYTFDVLMDIYRSVGYTDRDAVQSIVQNNLFGLDIDDRAAQLAYFALMMKACEYDRRFLRRGVQPHVCAIAESAYLDDRHLQTFGAEKPLARQLLDVFANAKEYGSLVQVDLTPVQLARLHTRLEQMQKEPQPDLLTMADQKDAIAAMQPLLTQAEILARKYDVVVTNPPYMGSSSMNDRLSTWVKEEYPDSKSDLFAVFMERCNALLKANGYQAMITQHAWMFLSSYERLRAKLQKHELVNMAHLGARAFDEIGGEVVQTTAFVMKTRHTPGYKGSYARLIEPTTQQGKEDMFLAEENRYTAQQENFTKIPGMPVAYWVSERLIDNFEKGISIDDISDFTGSQHITADNDKYLRCIWEIERSKVGKEKEWAQYAKGGEYRKWYGNVFLCVRTTLDAIRFYKTNSTSNCLEKKYWFTEGITYSAITSKGTGFRYYPAVGAFDKGGATICYVQHEDYVLALLNSKIAQYFFEFLNPTINLQVRDVKAIPVILDETKEINVNVLVKEAINVSKLDWDSFETSWDFKKHPLV